VVKLRRTKGASALSRLRALSLMKSDLRYAAAGGGTLTGACAAGAGAGAAGAAAKINSLIIQHLISKVFSHTRV